MSKAFTKEDDGGPGESLPDEPWPLPPGEKNYMTTAGEARLRDERARLREEARADPSRKREIERRLRAIDRRLDAAEVVDPLAQPADRVLFGATVRIRDGEGRERRVRIVGVDEADARSGQVSWLSPIARALLRSRVGDVVTFRSPRGDEELVVLRIDYESS